VHVYTPKTAIAWSLQALIRSPDFDQSNFGHDVWIDTNQRIVVSAIGYGTYI
jgi:hypothetical protein